MIEKKKCVFYFVLFLNLFHITPIILIGITSPNIRQIFIAKSKISSGVFIFKENLNRAQVAKFENTDKLKCICLRSFFLKQWRIGIGPLDNGHLKKKNPVWVRQIIIDSKPL